MPQVKRKLISSTTNLLYELPHELPNDSSEKLRIIGNQKVLLRIFDLDESIASYESPLKRVTFGDSPKKNLENFSSLVQF